MIPLVGSLVLDSTFTPLLSYLSVCRLRKSTSYYIIFCVYFYFCYFLGGIPLQPQTSFHHPVETNTSPFRIITRRTYFNIFSPFESLFYYLAGCVFFLFFKFNPLTRYKTIVCLWCLPYEQTPNNITGCPSQGYSVCTE